MPLLGILGGFESLKKHFFFPDFWSQGTKGNFGKISEIWPKISKKSKKVGKNRYNRNFGGDILSISTDNQYFGRNFGNFVP